MRTQQGLRILFGTVVLTMTAAANAAPSNAVSDEAIRSALQDAFVADERLRFERDDIVTHYADGFLELTIEHGERQAMIDWLASVPPRQAESTP